MMTLKNTSQVQRKKTLLVRDSQIGKRETEYDWRERLRQWKQVQQSAGAVTSFADHKIQAIKSSAFSVLGVLQANVSTQELTEKVEQSLVNGLRRAAGLYLLNFAMNLTYSQSRFFDLVQWLQGSLRSNQVQIPHYKSGLESCGNKAESIIKEQFT